MTTAIEENELNQELLELEYIAKNWLSELDLLEKDIQVLQKSFVKSSASFSRSDASGDSEEVLELFQKVGDVLQEVRVDSQEHLAFVNTLIDHSNLDYNVSLIEKQIRIEVKLKDLLRAFNVLRQMSNRLMALN